MGFSLEELPLAEVKRESTTLLGKDLHPTHSALRAKVKSDDGGRGKKGSVGKFGSGRIRALARNRCGTSTCNTLGVKFSRFPSFFCGALSFIEKDGTSVVGHCPTLLASSRSSFRPISPSPLLFSFPFLRFAFCGFRKLQHFPPSFTHFACCCSPTWKRL